MKAIQRRNVEIWLQFREKPMSIPGLVWANRRMYALLIGLFAAIGAFFYVLAGPLAACFLGVALLAVLVRDIGFYRRSAAIWPLMQTVMDWNKVEALLADDAGKALVEPSK